MNLTKKQAEFWVAILVLCIIVAAAITLVDYGIKAAILEQSIRLRELIEGEEVRRSGRKPESTIADGNRSDAPDDNSVSVPVLVDDAPGMETGSSPNGSEKEIPKATNRRAQSRRPTRPRGISTGDK